MDCIVHGVSKSQTWLSDFHFHFQDLRRSNLCLPLISSCPLCPPPHSSPPHWPCRLSLPPEHSPRQLSYTYLLVLSISQQRVLTLPSISEGAPALPPLTIKTSTLCPSGNFSQTVLLCYHLLCLHVSCPHSPPAGEVYNGAGPPLVLPHLAECLACSEQEDLINKLRVVVSREPFYASASLSLACVSDPGQLLMREAGERKRCCQTELESAHVPPAEPI